MDDRYRNLGRKIIDLARIAAALHEEQNDTDREMFEGGQRSAEPAQLGSAEPASNRSKFRLEMSSPQRHRGAFDG